MPLLVGYEKVAELTDREVSTVYGWVAKNKLPRNVYLGHGLFNLDKLLYHIDRNSLFHKEKVEERRGKPKDIPGGRPELSKGIETRDLVAKKSGFDSARQLERVEKVEPKPEELFVPPSKELTPIGANLPPVSNNPLGM